MANDLNHCYNGIYVPRYPDEKIHKQIVLVLTKEPNLICLDCLAHWPGRPYNYVMRGYFGMGRDFKYGGIYLCSNCRHHIQDLYEMCLKEIVFAERDIMAMLEAL